MPEETNQTLADLEALVEPAAGSSGGSLFAAVKVVLFVAVVVALECLMAYFFMPSPDQTAAWAKAALADAPNSALADGDEPAEASLDKPLDQVEVDLEEFSVSAFQPISNTTLRIDFHLYGIVRAEEEVEFHARLDENRHRFRERILVIMRAAELTDLTDAGLGLIKRRILEKTNDTLGKPLLLGVIFSDFSFVEQ
jgi:flagellar FliL protein